MPQLLCERAAPPPGPRAYVQVPLPEPVEHRLEGGEVFIQHGWIVNSGTGRRLYAYGVNRWRYISPSLLPEAPR